MLDLYLWALILNPAYSVFAKNFKIPSFILFRYYIVPPFLSSMASIDFSYTIILEEILPPLLCSSAICYHQLIHSLDLKKKLELMAAYRRFRFCMGMLFWILHWFDISVFTAFKFLGVELSAYSFKSLTGLHYIKWRRNYSSSGRTLKTCLRRVSCIHCWLMAFWWLLSVCFILGTKSYKT